MSTILKLNLSQEIQENLLCPVTQTKLSVNGTYLESIVNPAIRYPIIEGIPVLINEEKSLFSISDFQRQNNTTFDLHESRVRKFIKKFMPKITHNLKAKQNYKELNETLPTHAKILVIGGSIIGQQMEIMYANESFEIIGSDVTFGPQTNLISDAHDIPFADETFDCVIAQAVLEHVLDPERCVNEMHRVLKPTGIVYAETPFMQQVHMKQYDFTRFTHLGHRRLFRHFEEMKSGPCGGPGMSLAWSYTWFLRSFATTPVIVYALIFFGYITSFFLKYFDYFLIDKPGSYDAASFYFFMGKKSTNVLSDKELIKQFKGIKNNF